MFLVVLSGGPAESWVWSDTERKPLRSKHRVGTECWVRVLTPGRGTKCHLKLQGVPGVQRSESHSVVCNQGCALIFILQTISLISPEGCPFPPLTPNPIYNHKGQERSGVAMQAGLLPGHFTHLCVKQSCLKHSGHSFPTSSVYAHPD